MTFNPWDLFGCPTPEDVWVGKYPPPSPAPERGYALCEHAISGNEFASLPAGAQAFPVQQADGRWSRERYAVAWGHQAVPFLSCGTIGKAGGFGNQLFQYAFTRIFAEMLCRTACFRPWAGNKLFGTADPLIVQEYPHMIDKTWNWPESELYQNIEEIPPLLDISGYFQFHTGRFYAKYRQQIMEWFAPLPIVEERLGESVRALVGDHTLIALQLRRGDYGRGMFFVPPNRYYLDWLRQLWPLTDKPILYIATDDPAATLPDFEEYHPLTDRDIGIGVEGAEFFTDFYALTQARHMAISNSTFGLWAAMLARNLKTAARPRHGLGLVPFDPWDTEVLTDRHLDIPDPNASFTDPGQSVIVDG